MEMKIAFGRMNGRAYTPGVSLEVIEGHAHRLARHRARYRELPASSHGLYFHAVDPGHTAIAHRNCMQHTRTEPPLGDQPATALLGH